MHSETNVTYPLKIFSGSSIDIYIGLNWVKRFYGKNLFKSSEENTHARGEHPSRSVISIKLLCNFIEITFQQGCSPVNLLHIFRTPFTKNTSGWLLLIIAKTFSDDFVRGCSCGRELVPFAKNLHL